MIGASGTALRSLGPSSWGPARTSAAALVVRALTVLALVEIAGAGLTRSFHHSVPAWIGLVAGGQLLTFPAYGVAYASVARLRDLGRVPLRMLARIVVAGFGPLTASGGFEVDTRAWQGLDGGEEPARGLVGAMAILEWAILAPVVWAVTVALLGTGADAPASLLWPWALGVPAGALAALWLVRTDRLSRHRGRRAERVTGVLRRARSGIVDIGAMARHPDRFAGAWIGMTAYWALEIASFEGALRALRIGLSPGGTVLAYATGYLASRRSLPLGGAGLAELLLVYSLTELHVSLGSAVGAVLLYRAFNFVVVLVPALLAYRGLRPVLTAADGGPHPRSWEDR